MTLSEPVLNSQQRATKEAIGINLYALAGKVWPFGKMWEVSVILATKLRYAS